MFGQFPCYYQKRGETCANFVQSGKELTLAGVSCTIETDKLPPNLRGICQRRESRGGFGGFERDETEYRGSGCRYLGHGTGTDALRERERRAGLVGHRKGDRQPVEHPRTPQSARNEGPGRAALYQEHRGSVQGQGRAAVCSAVGVRAFHGSQGAALCGG